MRYGGDFGMNSGRGGMRGMGERGMGSNLGGGMSRGEPFRGRAGAYDSYFRRDFRTNQGDFSDRFGGGPDYGYRGMGRNVDYERLRGMGRGATDLGSRRMSRDMEFQSAGRGYDMGYRGTRTGRPRNPEGRGYRAGGRGDRLGGETNYGPGFGDRWETTTGYDIAYRNFER